jgi:hypothetical protein
MYTIVENYKLFEILTSLNYVFEYIPVMVAAEPIPDVQQFLQHLHPPLKIDKSFISKAHVCQGDMISPLCYKKQCVSNKNSSIQCLLIFLPEKQHV